MPVATVIELLAQKHVFCFSQKYHLFGWTCHIWNWHGFEILCSVHFQISVETNLDSIYVCSKGKVFMVMNMLARIIFKLMPYPQIFIVFPPLWAHQSQLQVSMFVCIEFFLRIFFMCLYQFSVTYELKALKIK